MDIRLTDAGKRFKRTWIFRKLSTEFTTTTPTAILGANGSGKSTLLKLLSGHLTQTEGTVQYLDGAKEIPQADIYKKVAIAAPYLQLFEQFQLIKEVIQHIKLVFLHKLRKTK